MTYPRRGVGEPGQNGEFRSSTISVEHFITSEYHENPEIRVFGNWKSSPMRNGSEYIDMSRPSGTYKTLKVFKLMGQTPPRQVWEMGREII